jgi:2-oxoacid:acceptor oxidoreductase gamma subunit (pyruvate/2-ketoisovalerate family)
MKEIRIHARAGQGAITTANILGEAYFIKGLYAYAFPHFGAARMGAPMNAFVRVDENPVRIRSQIYEPDYVIIVDSTLMRGSNCLVGLSEKGIVVINEREGIQIPKPKLKQKIYAVPANNIAQETIGRPLGNTALLYRSPRCLRCRNWRIGFGNHSGSGEEAFYRQNPRRKP